MSGEDIRGSYWAMIPLSFWTRYWADLDDMQKIKGYLLNKSEISR